MTVAKKVGGLRRAGASGWFLFARPAPACALAGLAPACALAGLAAGCAPAPPEPQTVVVVVPSSSGAAEPVPAAPEEGQALVCPAHMAFVAGGSLRSGSRARAVGDVCIDITEVTAGAYELCVERGQCDDTDLQCDEAWTYRKPELAEHPVNCVSWLQADRYCRAHGKRLPTWEEWEWAAQGRDEQRRYVWGDSEPLPEQMCWSLGAEQAGTCPVGSFPGSRSAQNIDDMFGNVWEWLTPQHRGGVPNVSRGGSWQNDSPAMLEGENAGAFVPGFVRNDVVGFRCAYDGGRSMRGGDAARNARRP